ENLILRNLELQPIRNTKVIEIRAFSDVPDEAAKLANQVATSYRQYRADIYDDIKSRGIKSLQQQVDEQQAKVDAAQTNVDNLRQQLGISDANENANAPAPSLDFKTLDQLTTEKVQHEALYNQQIALLNGLLVMTNDPEKLKKALPVAVEDGQLNSLLGELDKAQQDFLKLKADYGPDHPKYQSAKELVQDLTNKVNDRVDGILTGLQMKAEASKAYLDSINKNISEAKTNDIETATKDAPYFASKQKLETEQRALQALRSKTIEEQIDKQLPTARMVTIIQPAVPDLKPVRPNKPLNILLGVVFGLVVGVGLAFFIEYLDTSVKTIDDVERTLQAPVLGVIPQNIGLIMDEGAESPHAEAYRVLRTNILFSRKDEKLNTIVVVSAGAGEGKSTTAFNLATIFAQNGSRVLVVDSDLRRPTLHRMINVSNNIGLTNYLLKQNTLDEVIQITKVPTLHLMASGKLPSSSLGILSSSQMKDLISELKQRYDFVFFDSPPIMGVSDASILASEVDMTLQVIQYRRYPQPMNIRAKQMIEKVGGNLVGIVLNNINMSQDESYYYYSGYYHDYYYSKNNDQAESEAAPKDGDGGKPDIKSKY
ncbi:MAG TPA: polysaccharide biosynthesis tyrosine autokinase, partial [Verrucomicrobiae bacterium]|nr:polysaccharide biosynthesis tyrosine autokinase [Verrucomicrobiae bacterium]